MKRFQIVFLLVGAAALAWMVYQVGPGTLLDGVLAIGWGFLLTCSCHFTGITLDSVTLRACAGEPGREVPLRYYLRTSLSGHAINEATPFGKVGEITKYSMLSERLPPARAAAALVAQNLVMFVVNCALIALGAPLALVAFSVPAWARPGFIAAGSLFLVIGVAMILVLRRGLGRLPFAILRWIRLHDWHIGKLRMTRARVERWQAGWKKVEAAWREVARDRRRQRVAWTSAVLSRCANLTETALILHLLADISGRRLAAAAIVSLASSQLVGWLFQFVPMGAGTAEGGSYLVFSAVGLDPTLGVLVEVARRLRRLVFIAVGVGLLGLGEFRRYRRAT